jgi:hypothetical protein
LLSASRSLNERDYEKTREGTSAANTQIVSPTNDVFQQIKQLQQMQLQNNTRLGYTPEFENVIRLYMEQLQRQQGQQR